MWINVRDIAIGHPGSEWISVHGIACHGLDVVYCAAGGVDTDEKVRIGPVPVIDSFLFRWTMGVAGGRCAAEGEAYQCQGQ